MRPYKTPAYSRLAPTNYKAGEYVWVPAHAMSIANAAMASAVLKLVCLLCRWLARIGFLEVLTDFIYINR